MALESGTYVKDLVSTNPPGTDAISQGDDHIRLIKSVLRNSFPSNSNAPIVPDMSGQSGKYLTTDGTDSSWGTISLSGLTDTTISSPTSDQRLTYNGSTWVNTSDITIPSGATITNNGTATGFGKILNVWHALQTTSASVGNTLTYQNISDLYFTVTPQSTNSKFYMSYHWSGDNLTQGTGYGSMACFRDSTNIGGVSLVEVGVVMMSGSVYDAPATTSSITYRPKVLYDGATVNYGGGTTSPSFFLMEVDA